MTDAVPPERVPEGTAEPREGHVRRARLLALSGLGILLIAGLLLAMVQGTLEASLTIAGPAGKLSADDLTKAAAETKKASWTSLKERGVDIIPRSVLQRSQFRDLQRD